VAIPISVHILGSIFVVLGTFLWLSGKLPEELYSEITGLHVDQSKNCFTAVFPESLKGFISSSRYVRLEGRESFQFLSDSTKSATEYLDYQIY
jgi:hypothetical protein